MSYEIIFLSFGAGLLVAAGAFVWWRQCVDQSVTTLEPTPEAQVQGLVALFEEGSEAIALHADDLLATESDDIEALLNAATLADLTQIAGAIATSKGAILRLDALYTKRINRYANAIGMAQLMQQQGGQQQKQPKNGSQGGQHV